MPFCTNFLLEFFLALQSCSPVAVGAYLRDRFQTLFGRRSSNPQTLLLRNLQFYAVGILDLSKRYVLEIFWNITSFNSGAIEKLNLLPLKKYDLWWFSEFLLTRILCLTRRASLSFRENAKDAPRRRARSFNWNGAISIFNLRNVKNGRIHIREWFCDFSAKVAQSEKFKRLTISDH